MNSLCPNKDVCGSCAWSSFSYEQQLEMKIRAINDALSVHHIPYQCKTILPSPKTAHYRNRMDFVINFEGHFGLRQKGKWWKVIDNHMCFLADEQIDLLFSIVRDWIKISELSYFDRKKHVGFLRYAVIRATTQEETMITIITSRPKDDREREKALFCFEQLAKKASFATIIWSINTTVSDVSYGTELHVVSGKGFIEEKILDRVYKITPNAFFQSNPHTAPFMLKVAQEFLGDVSEKKLLDLYCGSGFFSIFFADKAKEVIGVEEVKESVEDAKNNASINHVAVSFYFTKSEDFSWNHFHPDSVILDPPRGGLHKKVLAELIQARPKQILYISCNFKHFIDEYSALSLLYRIKKMTAVDNFPHTPHVELMTLLETK